MLLRFSVTRRFHSNASNSLSPFSKYKLVARTESPDEERDYDV
jgi:hypothetical protein